MGRKYTPFTSLSRQKRRATTLHIKNLIYRERRTLGGIFYIRCHPDVALASGRRAWSDIIFLNYDPVVFWNAEIITANVAFADAIENIAFNEALSERDDAEKSNYCILSGYTYGMGLKIVVEAETFRDMIETQY